MFARFVSDSHKVVLGAREIASVLESPTLEAEHLLLAVARQPATTAGQVLVEAGLDFDQAREAFAAEFEGSLAAAGIAVGDFELPATAGTSRIPRWGTSAKLALKRAAQIADARKDRRITPDHILLGVLRAPVGTIPRTLDRAGIDRTELSRRVEAAL